MGVSRIPVREALHKLGLENLVHSIARAGYIVNDVSEYEVEGLFVTRTAMKGWVVIKLERDCRPPIENGQRIE